VYIGSLQSQSKTGADGQSIMHTMMTLELPQGEPAAQIEADISSLLQQMNLTGTFHAQT
jgi:glycine cleavage system transcriptional repressor